MPEIINEKCGICGGEFSGQHTWRNVADVLRQLELWRRYHKCREPETLIGTPEPLQFGLPPIDGIRP